MRTTLATAIACVLASAVSVASAQTVERKPTYIPAQQLETALQTFAAARDLQIIFRSDLVGHIQTKGVEGDLSFDEALRTLLRGTGLTYRYLDENSVTILPDETGGSGNVGLQSVSNSLPNAFQRVRLAQGADAQESFSNNDSAVELPESSSDALTRGIPEMLVEGARLLNADVVRSRDDIQPYVIFDAETIEKSGATSLDDFFRQRLPMNTSAGSQRQAGSGTGNRSSINLRGLGDNQTLILVDGKRQSSLSFGGTVNQPDINNIPMSAIERIEILPTSASGIYGGSAIGGVINIVLRRDFSATEVRAKYGDSFDGGGAMRQFDLLFGMPLRDGKTNIMFSGSMKEEDPLLSGERKFYQRGLGAIQGNNPEYLNSWMPLGTTPNIRSLDGSPLFGPGTPSFTHVPVGYTSGDGLAPLQQNAGQYNFESPNIADTTGLRYSLMTQTEVRSGTLTVRNEFTPRLSGFLDLSASANNSSLTANYVYPTELVLPASAPNNLFGQDVYIRAPINGDGPYETDLQQRQISTGLLARLPADWTGQVDYSLHRAYAENRRRGVQGAYYSMPEEGAIDYLQDTLAFVDIAPYTTNNLSEYRTTTQNVALRFSGPVWQLPGGRPTLNLLVENRKTRIGDDGEEGGDSGPGTAYETTNTWQPGEQDIKSAYLELTLPLVTKLNRRAGIEELEVQIAGRYDRYTSISGPERIFVGAPPEPTVERDFDSVDPTFGMKWTPIQDLALRASYSTGFLPPDVNQMGAAFYIPGYLGGAGPMIDPKRGNSVYSTYEAQFVGNPDLAPEESKSWSAGLIFTPRALPDLRVSLDYTRIEKSNAIISPGVNVSYAELIDSEDFFPERVVRAPADGLYDVGQIVFLDFTHMNAADVEVTAYDMQVDYAIRTERFGNFELFALATKQTEYNLKLLPSLPMTNRVGITSSAPLEWKANIGANWRLGRWAAGWNASYYDSYLVADPALLSSDVTFANQGGRKVSSQLYHDMYVSFDLPLAASWVSGAQVQLGANNVFNKTPPLDMGEYNWYSEYGDPRLARYHLSLRMNF